MTPTTRRRPAFERVVATADRLFYTEGIKRVGVDRIADEANVSKASLYTHFRTKDDLAAHYLRGRSEWWQELVTTDLAGFEAGAGTRILRVFELLGDWLVADGFHGCPFINAEAESRSDSPGHVVNLEHRRWVRELFERELASSGVTGADSAALPLVMVYDGSMVGAQVEPQRDWAGAALAAVTSILTRVGVDVADRRP